MSAYNDALFKHRFDCRYMGFIDADEFIVPKKHRDLLDTLNEIFNLPNHPKYFTAGVGINWRMFGSNGQDRKIEGGVLERFTFRAPDDFSMNLTVKTICNPRRVNYISVPHCCYYYLWNVCVNEHGEIIPESENLRNSVDLLQLNHYYTKSMEEFHQKLMRGRADYPINYQIDQNTKQINIDDSIEDTRAFEISYLPRQRQKNFCDDRSTIHDLKFMLESDSSIEKILTCFHRAQTLKNTNAREEFTDISIEKILQTESHEFHDASLFVDSLPEIISSRYNPDIIQKGVKNFLKIESELRARLLLDDQFEIQRRRILLESIL